MLRRKKYTNVHGSLCDQHAGLAWDHALSEGFRNIEPSRAHVNLLSSVLLGSSS